MRANRLITRRLGAEVPVPAAHERAVLHTAGLAWAGREEQAGALRAKAVLWSRQAAEALSLESKPREQARIWQRIGQACALKYDSGQRGA